MEKLLIYFYSMGGCNKFSNVYHIFYLWVNLYQCQYFPLVSWVNVGSQ